MTNGTQSTDQLIDGLARGLEPVQPLRPPALRAAVWLVAVGLFAAAIVLRWANLAEFAARFSVPRLELQGAATLLTGLTAVLAAFYLSLPDRSSLWRYAPLPPLALWIATSSLGCLRYGIGLGPAGNRLGESSHCFEFIVMVSLPLAALLYFVLRRARPLEPLPVALCAGLGVAALAASVLQFFHAFDTTAIDLAVHLAGVGLIVGAAAASRRALA